LKRSIFITRKLSAESVLRKKLTKNGWEVFAESLIRIISLDFSVEKQDFDWLFLSSSNGARIFLNTFTPKRKIKIGVVGEATAAAVRKFGFEPTFIGNTGNVDWLGKRFAKQIGTATVLFAGAESGSKKIRSFLPKDQIQSISIYRTTQRNDVSIPETSVVFLTSPSNAASYLKVNNLNGRIIVCIGQTTAEFVKNKGYSKILIPKSAAEVDVIDLLLHL